MQKWDVPANHNTSAMVPADIRNLPVSIKCMSIRGSIALGDLLRQYQINQKFLLVVGFWKQKSRCFKDIQDIVCITFTPAQWKKLWGKLTLKKVKQIIKIVGNRDDSAAAVRKRVKEWKKENSGCASTIKINAKIDSEDSPSSQRRVQCSIPRKAFGEIVGREIESHAVPILWRQPFPNPIQSSARTFN